MLSSDWLLAYEAERSFGLRFKTKNRLDYSVFGDLIDRDVKFYDSEAIPFVFQGIENLEDVGEALEDRIGLYDDDDDEEDDDDIFVEDEFPDF